MSKTKIETTQAAVLHAARDIRVENVALPSLGPNDVLIEMRSGGICGSDLHYYQDGKNGTNTLRSPVILGHEAAGIITDTGSNVNLPKGTAVAIEPGLPCRACQTCLDGNEHICPTGRCFGSPPTNGLFARHVVVPQDRLHALPAEIAPELGALIEPLAVAVWAVTRGNLTPGCSVLVTGAGPIGLLVARVAKIFGAGTVTIADVDQARLDLARSRGFEHLVLATSQGYDIPTQDRLFECAGAPSALTAGIYTVGPAGRVVVVGQAAPSVDGIPLGHLQRYEIDLVTSFRSLQSFPTAIELVASGQLDIADIVTAQVDLAQVETGLNIPTSGEPNLKVLITY